MQTAQEFYGKTYTPERADKLDAAFKTFNMALNAAEGSEVQRRAIEMAAKKELMAFA